MGTGDTVKLLFLGDIIGKPGRRVVKEFLTAHKGLTDLVIANVENVAHGFGIAETNLQELIEAGVDVFSGGNHTFDRKEIFDFIDKFPTLLRPANYPQGTPGRGFCLVKVRDDLDLAVINVMGRVHMEPLQSPFLVADGLISKLRETTNLILVDMHGEATAEKVAMGWYLDGKASVVVGTHTHVQTSDERILPNGTGYLTDAGCCGPRDGVIGMEKSNVFRRMIDQLPARLEVASGPAQLCGAFFTLDAKTGCALSVERVRYDESGMAEVGVNEVLTLKR